MCGYADCPKTDDRIICQLCEIWYPYGGKSRCGKMFQKWLKEDKDVQKMHTEYLLKEVGE